MDLSVVERVLQLAVEIQQIPAPTFEGRSAGFIRDRFVEAGLLQDRQDEAGNVYACLPGKGRTPPLVVSAHIDTVFPAGMALPIGFYEDQIRGPGIGDNALGVAGLLGLVWSLAERALVLPGDLWLAANVGEEGLGNLRGMRALVERFGKGVMAYLVLEGLALGQVYHRALSVQPYRICVHTQGGHAWVDFGRPSAINVLAGLIQRLAALPLPEQPRTTLNVGVISGGTSINTIASSAQMEVDMRAEEEGALKELVRRVFGEMGSGRAAAGPAARPFPRLDGPGTRRLARSGRPREDSRARGGRSGSAAWQEACSQPRPRAAYCASKRRPVTPRLSGPSR